MTSIEHRENRHGEGGYFVRRPRVTDALGTSLRVAYGATDPLPEGIARALAKLDRLKSHH
jgi:hypothetical protein